MNGDSSVGARCPCGASFKVDGHELTSIQACPKCATSYHVVIKLDQQTRAKTAILIPKDTPRREEVHARAPAPVSPARPRRPLDIPTPVPKEPTGLAGAPPAPGWSREADREAMGRNPTPASGRVRPLVKGGPVPAQTPPPAAPDRAREPQAAPHLPPGAQAVTCSCGKIVAVRRKDLEESMPCPGCGRTLRFEEYRDPQSLAPRIRLKSGPPKA